MGSPTYGSYIASCIANYINHITIKKECTTIMLSIAIRTKSDVSSKYIELIGKETVHGNSMPLYGEELHYNCRRATAP